MQNKYATGACDGWKNVRKDSLIGSTANVEGNPVLLNVNDISSRPKTAETLLEIVESEIEYILNVLQAILVAWCTDASGESAKMRRLLVRRYPWLVVLDCWAHQVQLVVGDLWRADDPLIRAMDRATEVVKWFNNHSLALGVLKKEQTTRRTKVLCLILPGATRWTSHFLCISRLLELEECLRLLPVATERHQTLMRAAGPKRDAKNKAAEILRTIVEPGFWEYLKSLWDVLRPFAIASNVTQGDNARLDTVLCTLAHLYHIFSKPSFPECVRRAVLPSLEKRWANADQPIFILAVVLNPYIRARAFHPNSAYRTPAGLRSLVSDAFQRFFGELPDYEMDSAFTDYVAWAGEWSAEGMNLANTRQAAKAQVRLLLHNQTHI
ncbi:ribonuclease H-like domain-containing protein [Schizophyllum amplum]|uniref:Ribonuclease H-like domain-containing protein n=1 Tax=Schizophyllum amplum TaxID=97359 RepID=A0A550BW57_9AGAR|nr:ribonuclease H-like domain-containing protein [Auriculariopsis ampla]